MSAQITWQQISIRTKLTVNAKDAVADGNKLMFRVTLCKSRGFHKIIVTLDASDTYTVELIKINNKTLEVKSIEKMTDVYVSMLNSVIIGMVV